MAIVKKTKNFTVDDVQKHPFHLITPRFLKRALSNIFVWSSMLLLSAAFILSIVVLGVVAYDADLLYSTLFKAVTPFFNSQLQKEQIVFPFWTMYLYFVSLIGVLISQKGRLWREILPQIFELRYAFFSKLVLGCFILTCIGAEFRVLEILDSFFYFFFEAAVKADSAQSLNFMNSDFSELPGGGMFLIAFAVKLLQLILLLTMHKRYGTLLLILCAPGLRFAFNGAPVIFPLLPFNGVEDNVLESTFGGKKLPPSSKSPSLTASGPRFFCVASNKSVCCKVAVASAKDVNPPDLQKFNKAAASKNISKSAVVDADGRGRGLVEKLELPERFYQQIARSNLTYDKLNLEHNNNVDFSLLTAEEQAVAIFFYGELVRIQALTLSSSLDVPIGDEYPDHAREQVFNWETVRSPKSIIKHPANIATAQDDYISRQNILNVYPWLKAVELVIPGLNTKSDVVIKQPDAIPFHVDFKSKQGILTQENCSTFVKGMSSDILEVMASNELRGESRVGVVVQYTSYDPGLTSSKLCELVLARVEKLQAYEESSLSSARKELVILQESSRELEDEDKKIALVAYKDLVNSVSNLERRVFAARAVLNDPEALGFINRVEIPVIDAYRKPLPYEKLVELDQWAEKEGNVSYNKRIGKR